MDSTGVDQIECSGRDFLSKWCMKQLFLKGEFAVGKLLRRSELTPLKSC